MRAESLTLNTYAERREGTFRQAQINSKKTEGGVFGPTFHTSESRLRAGTSIGLFDPRSA